MQRLAPVGGKGEHALGGVAVEIDIDVVEPDGAAHHVGLRFDGEVTEAAARQRLLSGPDQGVAHRHSVGGERAFDLERGLDADGAFERRLDRAAGDAQLQAGAVAGERGREIAERHRHVERLVVPDEAAGGAEALGNRRPGQRKFHAGQRLVELLRLAVQHHRAVVDAHLGERRDPVRVRGLAADERLDQAGPVGFAVRLNVDRDDRVLERHVGNLDPARQQWDQAQARGQPLGGERRPLGVAEHHVGEAHAAGREQRDVGFAAQDRVQAGNGADFAQDLAAHSVGRDQVARRHEHAGADRDHGQQR